MYRLVLVVMVGLGAALAGCGSSGAARCTPSDNKIAICQTGSHEECETRDNGCERCTCVPDRLETEEHGPYAPE